MFIKSQFVINFDQFWLPAQKKNHVYQNDSQYSICFFKKYLYLQQFLQSGHL